MDIPGKSGKWLLPENVPPLKRPSEELPQLHSAWKLGGGAFLPLEI